MSEKKFEKPEKLKSRKDIKSLFDEGESVYSFPVKILYSFFPLEDNSPIPVKCGVSVAKRKQKKAVTRNLLKRRMREAYRLNKSELVQLAKERKTGINLFILYLADPVEKYSVIEPAVKKCLRLIEKRVF